MREKKNCDYVATHLMISAVFPVGFCQLRTMHFTTRVSLISPLFSRYFDSITLLWFAYCVSVWALCTCGHRLTSLHLFLCFSLLQYLSISVAAYLFVGFHLSISFFVFGLSACVLFGLIFHQVSSLCLFASLYVSACLYVDLAFTFTHFLLRFLFFLCLLILLPVQSPLLTVSSNLSL